MDQPNRIRDETSRSRMGGPDLERLSNHLPMTQFVWRQSKQRQLRVSPDKKDAYRIEKQNLIFENYTSK